MKLKYSLALALSTLLFSAEALKAQSPSPSPSPSPQGTTQTPTPPVPPPPNPQPSPAPPDPAATVQPSPEPALPLAPADAPESELSPEERLQMQQLLNENFDDNPEFREWVQSEIHQQFGWTINLLNVLIVVLILFPITAVAAVWLLRRSVVDRVAEDVESKLGREFKAELGKEMTAVLEGQGGGSVGALARQKPEDVTQLKELVSMALSAQNVMSEAKNTLEDSLQFQQKLSGQLKELFDYHVQQGQASFKVGDYEKALALYDKALEIEANDVTALCHKGSVLAKLERYNKALAVYDRASQLQPELPDSWYGKARCYALQEDSDRAIENLKQAMQLNPATKEIAQSDPDFDAIKDNEWFQSFTVG